MIPVRSRYNTWQKVGADVALIAQHMNSDVLPGAPVSQREPNVNDSTWAVGALWRGAKKWYTCQRTGLPALWQPSIRPGSNTFSDVVPSGTAAAVGLYGTGACIAGWTGNLFDLTLSNGSTTKTFAVYRDGLPNLADINQFIGTDTGFVTKLYDQSGNTNNAVQATVANAPYLDTTRVQNGFPAIIFNFDQKFYATGATGKVFLDLPVGHSLTLNSHAMFFVGSLPNFATDGRPMTAGVAGGAALAATNTYAMLRIGGAGLVSWLRAIANTGSANAQYSFNVPINTGPIVRHGVHVYGYSRTGRTVRWFSEEASGSGLAGTDPGSGSITAGSLGNSQQFAAQGNVYGGDLEAYAFATYNADLGATVAANLVQAMWEQFQIAPQLRTTIVFDGTSTTRSTGGSIVNSFPRQVCDLMANEYSVRALNMGVGQTTEAQGQIFASIIAKQFDPVNAKLLVVNPGIGNSLQASGAFTVSSLGANASVLNISTSMTYPSFASIGAVVTVSGNGASVPAGTTIVAGNDPNNPTQLTLSNPVSGGVPTTMTVINSTSAQVWATLTAYLAAAKKAGYKVLLIGSASRGTFTTPQAAEFRKLKNLMGNSWQGYADVYVDLEADVAFGGAAPWNTQVAYWSQSDQQHYTPLGYALIASLVANAIQANDLLG